MNTFFRQLLTAFACTALMAVGLAPLPAFAVHTTDFELDENTADSPAGGLDDWENFGFSTGGNPKGTSHADAATGIVEDTDAKVFTRGSKDDKDINQWFWRGGSSPPKADLTDAYAASYQPGSDLIIYFGANRDSNNGTTTTGFWFFKNEITTNADGTFNGVHAVGDVLAVFNYDNGGHVGAFVIYKWIGGNDPLFKVAEGSNQLNGAGILCTNAAGTGAGDAICGVTNSATTEIPWASPVPPGAFFEGGINISQVVGGDTCFASFMATSRSSTAEKAEIKNFVLDRFPICGIEVTKVCRNPSLADSTHIRYEIVGKVSSTGSGTINNVALSDNPPAEGAFQSFACDANGLPTGASTGTFPLASLAGNTDVCYKATFLSTTNGGFTDTVTATASVGSVNLSDTATATCPQLLLEGSLSVTKLCTVVIEDIGSQIVVRVDFSGTVTNSASSDFDLTNVQVFNDKPAANTLVASFPTLAVGATENFSGSYYPSSIGGPLPGNPLCASFSDALTASGTGPAIVGSPTVDSGPPVSATCNLCPPGQVCPTP